MDMQICSECGHEYDALQPHECYFSMADVLREKATHGGKRTGAGRKPLGEISTERGSVTLLPAQWELAELIGDGNASEGIRRALDAWRDSEM